MTRFGGGLAATGRALGAGGEAAAGLATGDGFGFGWGEGAVRGEALTTPGIDCALQAGRRPLLCPPR